MTKKVDKPQSSPRQEHRKAAGCLACHNPSLTLLLPNFFFVLLVLSGDILAFFSFSEEVSGSGPTAVGHFDPLALSMLLNFNIQ